MDFVVTIDVSGIVDTMGTPRSITVRAMKSMLLNPSIDRMSNKVDIWRYSISSMKLSTSDKTWWWASMQAVVAARLVARSVLKGFV